MVSFQHHCNFTILVGICLVGTFVPSNSGHGGTSLNVSTYPLKGFLFGVTVDGSEIRRSPVELGFLSHYFQGFFTIPGG